MALEFVGVIPNAPTPRWLLTGQGFQRIGGGDTLVEKGFQKILEPLPLSTW